eukprot:jgi/Undpi1/13841/HiC_scaffold_9.g03492.m1
MKAPPFFALGTVFLGVAASALGFLSGTSAEQEGEERFGPHHPRHTFYCEHSATGDSVDQVLSGHITIFRPIVCETTQVVHVMAGKGLTLWSHGVLSTSNVHFVVHKDATLILQSKEGIDLRRHESSSRALIMAAGTVVINWPTRLVSLFDKAAINVSYRPLRVRVENDPPPTARRGRSRTDSFFLHAHLHHLHHLHPDDWDDDEEDVFGEDGESAVVDEATCSPAATTPTTNRDDTAVPFPPRNEVLEGHETEQLVCDDLKGENGGEEENGVEKENGGEEEEKNEKDEKEDEESQEEQDGGRPPLRRTCGVTPVRVRCASSRRGHISKRKLRAPRCAPAADEAVMFDHFELDTLLDTPEQEIGQSMSEDEEERRADLLLWCVKKGV